MKYCRLARILAAFTDIDATACFDNQVRNIIGIADRRLGADEKMSRCQTETLQKMEHRTRIQQGISKECISHSDETPIYGSGQGSGAGVINWHGHNEILIAMYNETQPGCKMSSPDARHEQMQRVISFVDDNKLARSFLPQTTIPQALEGCTESINAWRKKLEITGGALAPPKCNIQMLVLNFDTYSYAKHYPNRGQPLLGKIEEHEGQCKLWDTNAKRYHNVQQIDPTTGRKLLGVRLVTDRNCNDEFKAQKDQSERMAMRLAASNATPVDAYMIYAFRYCPAVFYCIPITYFTKAQCDTIQAPFMNVLLPKLRLNRHIKRAVVWGNVKYGGLALKHMATEQTAKPVESLIGHVRADTPTGKTFLIACKTYQMLLGTKVPFFMTPPHLYPHRVSAQTSKLTFLLEELHNIDCHIIMRDMWTPEQRKKPCIMDAVIQTRENHRGTVKYVSDETVRLVNACRLWLRALYVEDLFDINDRVDPDYLTGQKQCATSLSFPHQPRPPDWVWRIWRQTLCKVCLKHQPDTQSWYYYDLEIKYQAMLPFHYLPKQIRPELTLQQIVESLPHSYQQVLGEVDYPEDKGKALAEAIQNGKATIYSDGTVDEGCAAHSYTVRTDDDNEKSAVSGAAPTCGDPLTVSSLRPEHCGALAGLLWIWIITTKYNVQDGQVEGAIDNMTVVNRLNDGVDPEAGHQKHLATDYDLWQETEMILKSLPVSCKLRHVKGHQDDMYEKGQEGPLNRDAFWNVQMDRKAGAARLTEPLEVTSVFGTSKAVFVHRGRPIYTKIAQTIRNEILDPPLREYIQEREEWDDSTFEAVDWTALETALKKVTVHKWINMAKYMFNWQNTGYQKQQFEDGAASYEGREVQKLGMCPMGCGVEETPQHYLQCKILHEARIINRDFGAVSKWMKKTRTHPEMQIIIERSLIQWMTSGTPLEVWELQESEYRECLEVAILNQNYIGWDNMLKGRIARDWGDIQMTYYKEEVYQEEMPPHISATWWASEFIRQVLYFSLATWQHRNNCLHMTEENERKVRERLEAVKNMAKWYDRKDEFTKEDKLNFSRSFLERCTDTTAQIRLWLGKIVDIHKYNLRNTLHGYFPKKE